MKTLIEIATGNVVDTGDIITVNGVKQPLKDIDVPKLVAEEVLAFAQYNNTPTKSAEDLLPKKTALKEAYEEEVLIDFKNPTLKRVLLDWGNLQGFTTDADTLKFIALLWEVHPSSVLHIALQQIALEWEDPENTPEIGYVISMANGEICQFHTAKAANFEHFAFFETWAEAFHAKTICKELLDELF